MVSIFYFWTKLGEIQIWWSTGSQQLAFYVNLKEIPNNRFGTQSEIYWDDAYLNAQVGAITRGTYTLRIVDPDFIYKKLLCLLVVFYN